jgi:hypothetical protein
LRGKHTEFGLSQIEPAAVSVRPTVTAARRRSAAARLPQRRVRAGNAVAALDPLAAFELRCWARARLWRDGEIDSLHDAVDELHACAVAWGLVESIGQDAVQWIMSTAFAAVRDDLKPFCPDPPQATRAGTPESTVEALLWCLREQGFACLSQPQNRDRLARCDAAAMRSISKRLLKLGWNPSDIEKLIDLAEED